MGRFVCFDGLNLGLKRGTGVATYSRVLANLTRQSGHKTGILYALGHRLARRPLEREVSFFDEAQDVELPKWLHTVLDTLAVPGTAFGVRPQRLANQDVVVTRQFEATWVESDAVYAALRIFDRARASFATTEKLMYIRLDEKPDLFHWTYPLPILAKARANIYTVHDLVPIRLPYTTMDWKRYYIRSMREILKRADHIVTVSEHSKRDIMALFGVEEARITNTYQAIDIPQALIDRPEDVIANELAGVFGLEKGRYLLFYGSLEPKKNVNRIVQAFLGSKIDMPLVVVVAQNWAADEEARLLNQILEEDKIYDRSKERRRIRRYEYLSFRLLMTLVQGARAVVFPSLYEGFGLPVLEGMTLGTPVITANTSSTPEIAGDACLLVDPYKVDDIRRAMVAIAEDDDLYRELSRRGLAQAARFSRDVYGGRMAELYSRFL